MQHTVTLKSQKFYDSTFIIDWRVESSSSNSIYNANNKFLVLTTSLEIWINNGNMLRSSGASIVMVKQEAQQRGAARQQAAKKPSRWGDDAQPL